MNINLNTARGFRDPGRTDGDRSVQNLIDATADELGRHDDTRPIGPPLLIPEGIEYPGSYRVCFPVEMEGHTTYYVYVDADGVVKRFVVAMEGYNR